MKKTKIVCTLGPATDNKETLKALVNAGMNAARHNFSHGSHDEQRERMNMVKEVREELGANVAILLDTKGPEIRTGKFAEEVELVQGNTFTIICGEEVVGNTEQCSVSYDELWKDVKVGDSILIDDGLVGLTVENIETNKITCSVVNSGLVSSNKGVNVPGVAINLPALTEKDINDLKFGVEMGIDIVAASFVRKVSDVLAVKEVLSTYGGDDILVISKVENQEGLDNIDEIIKYSDGIMVARGDLGVEIPTEDVPVAQKLMIEKCNKAGKPVITATQMLDSMIRNPRPTRAEASDVANAIIDGTDAIMLSGETAKGKYPIEAVQTMAKIAEKTEGLLNHASILKKRSAEVHNNVPNAISFATCTSAANLNAKAIITATQSGYTAKMISRYRPECNVLAVTPFERTARRLALCWGVYPLLSENVTSTDELIDNSVASALQAGEVENGDLVVIAAGVPVNHVGSTNLMKVHIVGDALVQGKSVVKKSAFGAVKVAETFEEASKTVQEGDILTVKSADKNYVTLLDTIAGLIVEGSEISVNVVMECTKRNIPVISDAVNACEILKKEKEVTLDARRALVYEGKARVEKENEN